VKLILIAEN